MKKEIKMSDFLMIIFIIIPIILGIVTTILVINANHKLKNSLSCEGTIVEFYENSAETSLGIDSHATTRSPVISYSINGREYKFTANYATSSMKIGDKVTLLYKVDDPSSATIKNGVFLVPIITGSLTIFFILPIIIYIKLKNNGLINF